MRLIPAIDRALREVEEHTERERAEEAMRQSEHKYRELFECLSDAAFLTDEQSGKIIDTNRKAELVGRERFDEVERTAIALYRFAAAHAEARGIILADTKFEFGLAGDKLIWIDEALTPDSSRFWPKDGYAPGRAQPSFDKQFVRDYLESLHWNKKPPAPHLPADVVARTSDNYREALRLLTA